MHSTYNFSRTDLAIYFHFITVLFNLNNLSPSIAMEVLELGKAALTAPIYISVAWSLIISYQLFTQTAVYSTIAFLDSFLPAAGGILLSRIEMIVFIYAFAWIFVLSSVIPSVILGKGRSVLLQFVICLTLTLLAVSIEGVLTQMIGTTAGQQAQTLVVWFQNPAIAALYLSAPYAFMLYLDIRSRKARQKGATIESDVQESDVIEEPVVPEKNREAAENMAIERKIENKSEQKTRFLYGTGIVCFLFALLTLWLDRLIFSVGLSNISKLVYVALLTSFGSILIVLGYYTAVNVKHVYMQ
jgi:hypothetical protein